MKVIPIVFRLAHHSIIGFLLLILLSACGTDGGFILAPKVTVIGKVIGVDGKPIVGANVRIPLGTKFHSATTNDNGQYTIRISDDVIPNNFVVLISINGYVPSGQDINRGDADRFTLDFTLENVTDNLILAGQGSTLHHLGDDSYDGTINSQFQKSTDGTKYERVFNISQNQLDFQKVELTMFAKGLQRNNPLSINGQQITTLSSSESDGGFSVISKTFDSSSLSLGENTLKIESKLTSSDYDDFEFANIVLKLSEPIGNPQANKVAYFNMQGLKEGDSVNGLATDTAIVKAPKGLAVTSGSGAPITLVAKGFNITSPFNVLTRLDFNGDETNQITLWNGNQKVTELTMTEGKLEYASVSERWQDTSWQGSTNANFVNISVSDGTAKVFINGDFFASKPITGNTSITKVTISNINRGGNRSDYVYYFSVENLN